MQHSAVVISASSDIGAALCMEWSRRGWRVTGTFRTPSPVTERLEKEYGVTLVHCDLVDPLSLQQACATCPPWDTLVFAPGAMEPVGLFADTGFREWERSVQINFLRPLEVLHALLPKRGCRPTVLFFAGGGVNSAVVRYSGYTVSKIALMKMCELLDAEMPDVRFVIVGPGWVKTKIHAATLRAGEAAGDNLHKTQKRFAQDEWVSMGQVVACCTRLVTTSSDAVSGRNFSVKDDAWDSPILEETLERCPEMYKLRRCQNDWSPL